MTSVHNKRELSEKRLYLRKNQTNAERIIWNYLKAKRLDNLKFKRQHSIDWYIADFYCADKRLVIEIDGGSHPLSELSNVHMIAATLAQTGKLILEDDRNGSGYSLTLESVILGDGAITDHLSEEFAASILETAE
jgi:very-short-patch-repair endonuclease